MHIFILPRSQAHAYHISRTFSAITYSCHHDSDKEQMTSILPMVTAVENGV